MLIVAVIQPMLVTTVTSAVTVATTRIMTELRQDLLMVDERRKEVKLLKSQVQRQVQIATDATDTVHQLIYL